MLDRIESLLEARRATAVESLATFLRFASISADPARAGDTRACAEWLAGQFAHAGLTATVEPTAGHPIVFAKNEHRPGRPAVLLYGHYDVQPVDPIDLWTSPPFEPTVRDDAAGHRAIFARGAADDKGQIWAHVEALRAWHECGGAPVNLTVLIEGEEEIDSHHLEAFVRKHADALRADVAVISDTNQYARGVPSVTYGLRGLVYSEVTLRGPSHDLHSGIYGGAVPNPANALAKLIVSLHDDAGRVNIPGFYDRVVPLAPDERAAWAKLNFDDAAFAAGLGLPALTGEDGYTALERRWARPTCDVNGLTAGYQGAGAKTVIGATASAKVSFRLVPDQDPMTIRAAFERAVRERCPAGVVPTFQHFAAAPPFILKPDGPLISAAIRAVTTGFGAPPVLLREGLTIPVTVLLKRLLGIDTLLVGFGLPDDRPHSPNEKFDLQCLWQGSRTAAALYGELGRLNANRDPAT